MDTNNNIVAAVFYDDKKDTVRLELTNFGNKEDALEAANFIIATLGITKTNIVSVNETVH